jgi:RimJ/RimL family protein N-acetyltransferase
MKNAFLIGDRIYLRPLELEDAPTCATWFNDQEVTRYLLRYRPLALAEERDFLIKLAADPTVVSLGIALRSDDRLIGSAGLHHLDHKNRCSAFGIAIGEKAEWSKGYGSEATSLLLRHAFDTVNLHRVWLHVHAFNERAIGCYERLGFRREGVLRDEVFRDGRYWDTLVMGILEQEWRALQAPRAKPMERA